VNLNSSFHKIKLLYQLEKEIGITHLCVDVKIENMTFFDIPNNMFQLMKKVFRIERAKPKNKNELIKLYISMIKNIACPEIIISTKATKRNDRNYKYELNKELLKYHIELDTYVNKYLSNYNTEILEMLQIEKLEKEELNDPFLDNKCCGELDKGIKFDDDDDNTIQQIDKEDDTRFIISWDD
jgi:hypothetical protein